MMSTYYNRIAAGKCVFCGVSPPQPDRRACVDCAIEQSERRQREYMLKAAEGLCVHCGQYLPDGATTVRCKRCLDRVRAAKKRMKT